MSARRTTAAVLAAGLLIVLAGCSDDDDDTATESTPAVSTAPSATTSEEPSTDASADPSASASASSSADAEEGQTIKIDLVDGKPTEKVGPTITVNKGDTITLVITSDKEYEVHVHATDTAIDVGPDGTVTKTITIDAAPGSYEVEVEETGFKLFTLVVK